MPGTLTIRLRIFPQEEAGLLKGNFAECKKCRRFTHLPHEPATLFPGVSSRLID
jgi:hypothetical protein